MNLCTGKRYLIYEYCTNQRFYTDIMPVYGPLFADTGIPEQKYLGYLVPVPNGQTEHFSFLCITY